MNKDLYLEKLAKDSQIVINVKAFPGSGKMELTYLVDSDLFEARIKGQADRGQANSDVIKLLSTEFSVPKENIKILSGKTTRNKLIKLWN